MWRMKQSIHQFCGPKPIGQWIFLWMTECSQFESNAIVKGKRKDNKKHIFLMEPNSFLHSALLLTQIGSDECLSYFFLRACLFGHILLIFFSLSLLNFVYITNIWLEWTPKGTNLSLAAETQIKTDKTQTMLAMFLHATLSKLKPSSWFIVNKTR